MTCLYAHRWLDGFDPLGDAELEKRVKRAIKAGPDAEEVSHHHLHTLPHAVVLLTAERFFEQLLRTLQYTPEGLTSNQ